MYVHGFAVCRWCDSAGLVDSPFDVLGVSAIPTEGWSRFDCRGERERKSVRTLRLTPEEIVGLAYIMREKCERYFSYERAVNDLCALALECHQ